MEDRLRRIQRIQVQLAEEVHAFMQALFASSFDAATILSFAQRLGVDISGSVPGTASRQAGIDPYKVLGLDRSSAEELVRRRYRDLLRKIHPDTAGVEGTEFLTQMVNDAYRQILRERGWR
jgi:DnaJ-domain-containing protein 1